MTRGELEDEVALLAGGLRSLGVGVGDRVAAYLPNVPEAVAAFLACASIGAIWSSCSPDFGARSVIDRFAQIEPKVLLAVDGYRYGGKDFDRTAVVQELLAELPTVEHTVLLGYLDRRTRPAGIPGAVSLGASCGSAEPGRRSTFEQVPSDHPLWVLYSSGTTGLPKAIVHGHGGIILESLKKMFLHVDLQADDRLFWFTTTGWMMWNFLVSGLFDRRLDRALRREPRHPRPRRALGSRRRRGDHVLRDERRIHRRLPEGGAATGRRPRSLGAPLGRVDRLAALARGLRLGLRGARRRHLAVLDLRWDRRRHGVRRRRPDPARSTGVSCRRGRSASGSNPGARREGRSSARSASS